MSRLEWDSPVRPYRLGVDRGVLYPRTSPAVAWNGLVSVTENPTDGDLQEAYFDGQKYTQGFAPSGVSFAVEAFTYPDELDEFGVTFDFSYRSNTSLGYLIHLVYNARVSEEARTYTTVNETSDLDPFEWVLDTIPEPLPWLRATSHLIVAVTRADEAVVKGLEDLLYGTATTPPRFPSTTDVIEMFGGSMVFIVIDHGDGTWTATGPDSWFQMLDPTQFKITTPSARYLDPSTYLIRSW